MLRLETRGLGVNRRGPSMEAILPVGGLICKRIPLAYLPVQVANENAISQHDVSVIKTPQSLGLQLSPEVLGPGVHCRITQKC